MLIFSACIEMIFRDRPFLDRIDAVADSGLQAFEFWGWRDKDLDAIRERAARRGLQISSFGMDTGGAMVDATRTSSFLEGLTASIEAAHKLAVRTLICTVGQEIPGVPRAEQHGAIVEKLKSAVPVLEEAGIVAVVEPLNILVDHRGYYLSTSAEGLELIDEVGSPNVLLLFDIYHQQITEGNVTQNLTHNIDRIGHVHVADVPGRHEPGSGELNYTNIFKALEGAGYRGYVGLEYMPSGNPAASLQQTLRLAA
jgi:hydroxypyruvate isomerase